jgi:hypothetical protein
LETVIIFSEDTRALTLNVNHHHHNYGQVNTVNHNNISPVASPVRGADMDVDNLTAAVRLLVEESVRSRPVASPTDSPEPVVFGECNISLQLLSFLQCCLY